MMGFGLIMTCHLKETTDDDGKVVGYKPDLNNRCLKIVNGLVDIIGVITQTWNEKEKVTGGFKPVLLLLLPQALVISILSLVFHLVSMNLNKQ